MLPRGPFLFVAFLSFVLLLRVKFSSVEKERELCRARSPSFRFSTKIIIVGNLLMKRDSSQKDTHQSRLLLSLMVVVVSSSTHAASKNKGGTLERPPPPPRPRPVESCLRPVKAVFKSAQHIFCPLFGSFFTQLNKLSLKETIETIEFTGLYSQRARKNRSPLPAPTAPASKRRAKKVRRL